MKHLRRTFPALVGVALATTLVACETDDSDTTSDTKPNVSTASDAPQAEGQDAEVFDLYNEALDNLDIDRFDSDDIRLYDGTGDFEYTLADINGDDLPEMLVAALGETFSNVKVFTVDAAGVVETDALFPYGAATAGGGRAAFHTSADGDGVFRSLGKSGTGEYTTSRWTLEGDQMVEGQKWEYRIDQIPADLEEEQAEVEWTSTDDRTLLGGDDATQDTEDRGDGPNPDPPATDDADQADDVPADTSDRLPQTDFALAEDTGTTCGTVDGVTVTAGSATTCGFAMNVAQQALQPGTWAAGIAPSATVTAPWGSTTVTASSPATEQIYTLDCNSGTDHARASCTGGNNAEVRFEKTEQGGLMYLLG